MSTVKLAVVDGNTINQTLDLRASKQGAPARIKAVKGGKFILADSQTGHGPENVTVRRVGKNLHLSLEGTDLDQPQLIVEDFYGNEGSLVGLGEDGAYHEYISSDADDDRAIAMLADGNASPQVLGAEKLAGFDAGSLVAGAGAGLGTLGGLGLFGLAALGMLGAAAAAGAFSKNDGPNSGGGDGGDGGDGGNGNRPKAPSIDSAVDNVGSVTGPIGNGGVTDDRRPVFSGKGETPGNRIELWDGDKKIGETVVKADGTWELQPAAPLDNGPHNIVAVEVDKNGNKSEPSPSFDFIVDTTAPDKAVIESIYDNVEPVGAIENEGLTNDNRPTLSGRGEPGARLEVFANGEKIGETTVDEHGRWTFRPEKSLGDGPQEFTVVASDAAGNVGLPSDPWTVIIDTYVPEKPVVGDVTDNVGDIKGPIDNGGVTDDDRPTFTGGGQRPGDTVTIIDDQGNPIGSGIVDEEGNWSVQPDEPLDDGEHRLELIVTTPGGNSSEPSDPWDLIVDTTPPAKPSIGNVWDDESGELVPIGEGEPTRDKTPVIGGSGGEPGNTIIVIVDGQEVGTAKVDENGDWKFEMPVDLDDGEYKFEVIEVDPAGNRSELSEPVTVIVDTTAPDAPSITEVFDNVGGQTGPLIPGDVTDDANPKVSGQAEPFSWVTLYDGDRIVGTAQADANGRWEITTDTLLNGPHSLTAKATDAAGNVSEPSNPFDFDLVTGGIPAAPTIQNVIDNEGDNAGSNISPGGVTDDTRPTIIGTAKEGMVVRIYDTINGEKVLLGSVVAGPGDRWEFEVPADKALSEGLHNLSATATDPAGNVSPETGLYPIEVDTTPPNALEDLLLFDDVGDVRGEIESGDTTDDDRPTFSGRGEEGATIIIRDNGVVIGSTTVKPDGTWSWEPTEALRDGPHSFTAQPVDAAGNKGPETAPIDFVVDTRDVEVSITSVMDNEGTIKGPIASNGVTDDTTPTVIGRATPNGIVKIYDGEALLGSVTADALGNWTFEVPADKALSEGVHTLNVTVTVPGQNESAPASFTFEVDTTAPDVGVIVDIHDDVGDPQGTIDPGTWTDDNTPTLSGTAEANAWVIIRYGNTVLGSVKANGDGEWSFTPENALADGTYDFNIVVRDAAGNESAPSVPWQVIIDTTPPAKPSIDNIWDDTSGELVPIPLGGSTRDETPVIGGHGEAGSTIEVFIDGTFIGTAIVRSDETWTFEPSESIGWGQHQIEVVAKDLAGNRSETSEPVVVGVYGPSWSENFDRAPQGYVGTDWSFGHMHFTSDALMQIRSYPDYTRGLALALNTTGSADHAVNIALDYPVSQLRFTVNALDAGNSGKAIFYAENGDVLDSVNLIGAGSSYYNNVNFSDPDGRAIASVRIEIPFDGSYIFIDDFVATGVTVNNGMVDAHDIASNLDSIGGEVFYLSEGEEEALEAEGSERIDVLKLTGSDQVLDLSNLEGKLSSIEVIDLTGTGANTLKLTLGDVLEQGGKDLFVNDGKTQMMIKGAEGDVVELSDLLPEGVDVGDWAQQAGTVTVEGTTYNVFYHSGMNAELLVQQGVTTHLENH